MRVSGELAMAIEASEDEAEHDLPEAVALGLWTMLELLEADAAHVRAHEHALARHGGDHLGHHDERVALEDARQRALVLRLELVVELLDDPLPYLLGDRLDIEPRRHALEQAQDHVEVLQVRAHRRGHARILDLDRNLAAILERPAIYLADRRRRYRLLLEGVEELRERLLEILLDHAAHLLE